MATVQQFDFSVNLLSALLWQHNDATELQSLLTQKQAWYTQQQTQFWNDWVTNVFDLRTANQFGLSVWSVILNLPLGLNTVGTGGLKWGFGALGGRSNFMHSTFGTVGQTNVTLDIEHQRIALQLRVAQLITRPTVTNINEMLARVLGSFGKAYVLDGGNMTMDYVFAFTPDSQLKIIIEQFNLLPVPSAVKLKIIYANRANFGYGPYNKNFNNGTFGA